MGRLDALQDVVAAAVRDNAAPGAVVALSTRRGPALFTAGTTTVGGHDPIRADHWFEIGSVTKVLTATAVMRLVQAGRLDLDRPVTDLVPELRLADPDATRALRLRHLLTHTSGIDAADDFTDTGSGDDCLARYVAEVIDGATTFHLPGERWSYCNAGYSVLGRVIELVTDRPWDDAVRELVFDPAEMEAATTRTMPATVPVAPGHRYDHDRHGPVADPRRLPASVGPAGNVVTTAASLLRFAERLVAPGSPLVDDRTRASMFAPQVEVRDDVQALGWVLPAAPVRLALHGGQTIGCTALLATIVDAGTAMVVLANGPGAGAIAQRVQQHLFDQPPPEPAATVPIDRDELDQLAGTYVRRHVTQRVARDGDELLIRTDFSGPLLGLFPEPEARARHLGDRRFESPLPDGTGAQRWDVVDVGGAPGLFSSRLHRRSTAP